MNETLLAKFREQLTELKADLDRQDQRGVEGQKTVVLDQQSVGRLSRMDAIQHQAMAVAIQTRRDQQKSRITATFAHMDEGEYGYCTECGEDIALKRLELDPTLPTCINCAKS
jgi:DnaK suppressor protein